MNYKKKKKKGNIRNIRKSKKKQIGRPSSFEIHIFRSVTLRDSQNSRLLIFFIVFSFHPIFEKLSPCTLLFVFTLMKRERNKVVEYLNFFHSSNKLSTKEYTRRQFLPYFITFPSPYQFPCGVPHFDHELLQSFSTIVDNR